MSSSVLDRGGARESAPPQPQQPATIARLLGGVAPGMALLAGMQLDVWSALRDGPRTAAEVAVALGVDSDRLACLLYALVATELLIVEDGRFANTPEGAAFLVRGEPAYLGGQHAMQATIWRSLLVTAETIRTGVPQNRHDYATLPDDELLLVLRGLSAGARDAGRDLARRFDFANCRAVADVGGGSGALALALAEAYPHLRATVIDLPRVAPVTRRLLAELGGDGRVEVLAADATAEPLPGTYDAVVLRAFTQVLAAAENRRALRHVHAALAPGGALYILAAVLDDDRISPANAAIANLTFLNVYDHGRAYTEGEYRDWLAEAGFTDIERTVIPGKDFHLLTARKQA